jgi:hypothetical protein
MHRVKFFYSSPDLELIRGHTDEVQYNDNADNPLEHGSVRGGRPDLESATASRLSRADQTLSIERSIERSIVDSRVAAAREGSP